MSGLILEPITVTYLEKVFAGVIKLRLLSWKGTQYYSDEPECNYMYPYNSGGNVAAHKKAM